MRIRSSLLRLVAALLLLAPTSAFARPRLETPTVESRADHFDQLDGAWRVIDGARDEATKQRSLVLLSEEAKVTLSDAEVAKYAEGMAPGRWASNQTQTADRRYALGDRVRFLTPETFRAGADKKNGLIGMVVAVKGNAMQLLFTHPNGQQTIQQVSRFQVMKKLMRGTFDQARSFSWFKAHTGVEL